MKTEKHFEIISGECNAKIGKNGQGDIQCIEHVDLGDKQRDDTTKT